LKKEFYFEAKNSVLILLIKLSLQKIKKIKLVLEIKFLSDFRKFLLVSVLKKLLLKNLSGGLFKALKSSEPKYITA